MSAQYPDVPQAPGVPPVLRAGNPLNVAVGVATVLASDAVQVVHALTDQRWGLFSEDGQGPDITGDNVLAVEVRQEQRISDYPLEQGSFASYNKVNDPIEIRVAFTFGGFTNFGVLGSLNILGSGGGDAARAAFLNSLDQAINTLGLYTVATREKSYPSLNVIHYDYRRTASNGATLLTVDVWCREVRIIATSTYSNTKSTDGADPVNGGTVSAQDPLPAGASGAVGGLT